MKAIINGKIICKDGIVENRALVFSDVIEGIFDVGSLAKNVAVFRQWMKFPRVLR